MQIGEEWHVLVGEDFLMRKCEEGVYRNEAGQVLV
jgi:hypothetical protein